MASPFSFLFWEEDPDMWDQLQIADLTLRLVTIVVKKGGDNDHAKPLGTGGARVTHLGYEPAQIEIKIRMWEQQDLDVYMDLIRRHVQPLGDSTEKDPVTGLPKPAAPKPLDVFHPALAVHRINSLYVDAAHVPTPTDVPGVWEAQLICQEWNPLDKRNHVQTPASSFANDPGSPSVNMGLSTDKAPPSQTKTAP